jgi:hypothetical protein
VDVVGGIIMSVGRIARSWIHAEGVMLQEKASRRGDPSALAQQGGIAIGLNDSLVGWTDIYFGEDGNQGGVMVTPK